MYHGPLWHHNVCYHWVPIWQYINIFTRCTNRNQHDIRMTSVANVSKEQTDMSYKGELQTLTKLSMRHKVYPGETCCTTISKSIITMLMSRGRCNNRNKNKNKFMVGPSKEGSCSLFFVGIFQSPFRLGTYPYTRTIYIVSTEGSTINLSLSNYNTLQIVTSCKLI